MQAEKDVYSCRLCGDSLVFDEELETGYCLECKERLRKRGLFSFVMNHPVKTPKRLHLLFH